jgi:uncharacterized protein YmfQ (DUF2313 family)
MKRAEHHKKQASRSNRKKLGRKTNTYPGETNKYLEEQTAEASFSTSIYRENKKFCGNNVHNSQDPSPSGEAKGVKISEACMYPK